MQRDRHWILGIFLLCFDENYNIYAMKLFKYSNTRYIQMNSHCVRTHAVHLLAVGTVWLHLLLKRRLLGSALLNISEL